jgi:predicted negative regulator of RcsB-dependent stress response
MATLQTDEANIIDAESINWRAIVWPVLIVLVLVAGGFGYYYYQQVQRDTAESNARAALVKATTPDEFLKVAQDFPGTDQAMLALLGAADAAYNKHDYDSAISAYNKIIDNTTLGAEWHDTAQLGIGSCQEAKGDADKAIEAYTIVAQRREASPFAPYAYHCIARIYDQRGDKVNESSILGQAKTLDAGSEFTQLALSQLKALTPEAPVMNVPMQAPANLPAPTPVKPPQMPPAPAH